MATIKDFYQGARPKTLSAAFAPVIIGAALAAQFIGNKDGFSFLMFFSSLIVGLALQVGVNYANDYSDGKKGTDNVRVGPVRLVGQGIASPKSVFIAMCISFFIAALAGLYIASETSWWMILVGALCIALAYLYTGTKFAYGYFGFGELVVFICFGLVATVGTFYAITQELTLLSFVGAFIPGLFGVNILLANNIRDIDTDKVSNKKTLPSRIGRKHATTLFKLCNLIIVISIVVIGVKYHWAFIALLAAPFIGQLNIKLSSAQTPPDFIGVLVKTSKLNLLTSVLLSVGIALPVIIDHVR